MGERRRPPRRALLHTAGAALALALLLALTNNPIRREVMARLAHHTVESRLAALAPRVDPLWQARCRDSGAAYPPAQLTIVVLKRERELRVYAPGPHGRAVHLATFPILAASGELGPKLKEGDRQVPEGFYRVESLNPNSRYHLALRVNYPSTEDSAAASSEGRTNLGSDIMIHGSNVSIGCVALGDPAIEELFTLVAQIGLDRVELLMCPSLDPAALITPSTPVWLSDRYLRLADRLGALAAPQR